MLPDRFLTRMKSLLGDEYVEFLASYDEAPSVGLRVNTLKLSQEHYSRITPYSLSPIPWIGSGFTISPDERPGKHPHHAAGLYYIQDPSAMVVAELLDPQPGERVLDLAAAPGGKTTHIASLMKNQGLLVANDIHSKRVRDLVKNVERWGAQNVVILNETPSRLVEHFGSFFDRVLVDAPCSGEGMFRKEHSERGKWSSKLLESYAAQQLSLLNEASRLVQPGGRMVYATCTFSPEENERVIHRFLKEQSNFKISAQQQVKEFSPGRPEWVKGGTPALGNTIRLWPHKSPGEGHFVAVLDRKDHGSYLHPRSWGPASVPKDRQTLFDSFAESTLKWRPPQSRLACLGSHLYLLPDGAVDLSGLRVVHWGWWMGTFKTKRFEPAYALAMGLQPQDFNRMINLSAGDPETMAYLHGEVLFLPGEKGWGLTTVEGFPLCRGKRSHDRLKSHSPKWLRWI